MLMLFVTGESRIVVSRNRVRVAVASPLVPASLLCCAVFVFEKSWGDYFGSGGRGRLGGGPGQGGSCDGRC